MGVHLLGGRDFAKKLLGQKKRKCVCNMATHLTREVNGQKVETIRFSHESQKKIIIKFHNRRVLEALDGPRLDCSDSVTYSRADTFGRIWNR